MFGFSKHWQKKGQDDEEAKEGNRSISPKIERNSPNEFQHLKPKNSNRDASPKKTWINLFGKNEKKPKGRSAPLETIVVNSFEELPKEFQKMIKSSKIPPEVAKENFHQLLIILSFCSKKNLKLKLPDGSLKPSEEPLTDDQIEDICHKMNERVWNVTNNFSERQKKKFREMIEINNRSSNKETQHKNRTSTEGENLTGSGNQTNEEGEKTLEEGDKEIKSIHEEEEEEESNITPENSLENCDPKSLISQTIGPRLPTDISSKGEKILTKNVGVSPKKKFKISQESGQGGFGKVYEAKGPDGSRVAVKKVAHVDKKDIRSNLAEIGLLASADHPNIVQFKDAYQLDEELWIIMEFMEGGTLTQATEGCSFKEQHISYVAREILKGIAYLHRNNYVHRDLKSGNVMMSITGQIKLIDFGLCCSVFSGSRRKMAGSPYWMPPEMIQRKPYGFPIDIWSMGICLLEMANKSPPNNQPKLGAMFRISTKGIEKPLDNEEIWTKDMHDFFAKALLFDPVQRSTAFELLEHPFVNKAQDCLDMQTILRAVFLHTALRMLEV